MTADVLVAGGGLGGVAAALACARRGVPCVVCEPGPALGGQLTAQAVPPDEHPCVERRGVTAGYRALREAIRERYRRHEPLTAAARARAELNPGQGTVSRLCHEPRVSLAVLDELLAPHRAAGLVDVRLRHRPLSAEVEGDRITVVTFADEQDGGELVVRPRIVLEATETGVLLELAGVEHRVGAESVAQTGEPHARPRPEPGNLQPVTWCFAVDHQPGEDHTIGRPPGYDEVAALRPAGLPAGHLTLTAPDPRTGAPVARTFRPDPPGDPAAVGPDFDDPSGDRDLWLFRRIAAAGNFAPGAYAGDITLACWPQLDFLGAPYLEGRADAAAAAAGARRLARCFLHWLQTDAPREDGGTGWPGLRLRGDALGGGRDDLALAPYVREGRRLLGRRVVVEQDVAAAVRGPHGAVSHADSVGVGAYRIDLHPSTGGDGYLDIAACPFELPLGALLPVRVRNLVAAGKAIATTHVTNGCYRVHPVEWNAGEVAGALAATCVRGRTEPHAVHDDPRRLEAFRDGLAADGVQLRW